MGARRRRAAPPAFGLPAARSGASGGGGGLAERSDNRVVACEQGRRRPLELRVSRLSERRGPVALWLMMMMMMEVVMMMMVVVMMMMVMMMGRLSERRGPVAPEREGVALWMAQQRHQLESLTAQAGEQVAFDGEQLAHRLQRHTSGEWRGRVSERRWD